MAEYIEREVAIAAIRNLYPGIPLVKVNLEKWHEQNRDFMVCETTIEHIPAADVRPVVRGKWETVMLDHERMGCRPTAHYCSECHHITWFRTFFCPNCGADMRQTGDENV